MYRHTAYLQYMDIPCTVWANLKYMVYIFMYISTVLANPKHDSRHTIIGFTPHSTSA